MRAGSASQKNLVAKLTTFALVVDALVEVCLVLHQGSEKYVLGQLGQVNFRELTLHHQNHLQRQRLHRASRRGTLVVADDSI